MWSSRAAPFGPAVAQLASCLPVTAATPKKEGSDPAAPFNRLKAETQAGDKIAPVLFGADAPAPECFHDKSFTPV
jgi:hypothetical protein